MSVTQIPFARGVPSPDMFPADDLREAAERALRDDPNGALAYAPGGYRPLREWIGARHGVDADRVLLVNGSLQGLVFLALGLFHGSPGTAVVEDPTYDRTLKVLRTFGADVEAVPVAADGVDVDGLAAVLDRSPAPRLVYLIPTFQNPSGVSLSVERRHAVASLLRGRDIVLVEDDPYGLLRFEGATAPTLHELAGADSVIYSSSFTKTIAPGVRTGYLVLPERLVGPLGKISSDTSIAPNSLAEATLAAYCRAGRFEPNVERATAALRERRDAMEEALREHFPAGSSWTTPEGGYFFWVALPEGFDTSAALGAATAAGVPYVPGPEFSASEQSRRSLRLAFSAAGPDQIREGIARLGGVLTGFRQPTAV